MLFFLGWHYNQRVSQCQLEPTSKQFLLSWEILASFTLFTLVTALRYHTGWDHEYYIQDYVTYQKDGTMFRGDFEIGFRFIETIFAKLGLHYSFFFGFLGFINIFFIYYALRNDREVVPWVGLFIMMGPYFLHIMNSMRQGIVECVFVSLVMLVDNKKYIWYFIVAILLTMIHKVAFLIIPLFFVAKFPLRLKKTRTIIICYISCFVLGQFPSLISWTINVFGDVLSFFGYQKYVTLFNTNPLYSFNRVSLGAVSVCLILMHLFLILYYNQLNKHYKDNKFFSVCYSFAIIYICYFVLVMNTSFYFKRPCELLLPFFMISSGYLTVYLYKNARYAMCSIFAILNSSVTLMTIIKDHINGLPDSTDYYHFIPI